MSSHLRLKTIKVITESLCSKFSLKHASVHRKTLSSSIIVRISQPLRLNVSPKFSTFMEVQHQITGVIKTSTHAIHTHSPGNRYTCTIRWHLFRLLINPIFMKLFHYGNLTTCNLELPITWYASLGHTVLLPSEKISYLSNLRDKLQRYLIQSKLQIHITDVLYGGYHRDKQRSCLTLHRRSPGQTGRQVHSAANRFHWSDSVSEQWWDHRASSDPMSSHSGLLLLSPTGAWEKKRTDKKLILSIFEMVSPSLTLQIWYFIY